MCAQEKTKEYTQYPTLSSLVESATASRDETTAHLIASAPEMLEAGRAVIAAWESGDLAGAVRDLAAAIASAEGRDEI